MLIVEDDEVTWKLLSELLEAEGCRVEVAGSGSEALELARALQPDFITLDLGLPGRSGFDVLHRLRLQPETWEIPILVITGYPEEVLPRSIRVSDDDFFSKPILLQRYLRRVRSLIKQLGLQEH